MTITEFLEARIAEDETAARDFEHEIALALNGSYGNWELHYGAPADWRAVERIGYPPARVLAECAAKRAIIERSVAAESYRAYDDLEAARNDGEIFALDHIIRTLAAVYADHPDYDPEWA